MKRKNEKKKKKKEEREFFLEKRFAPAAPESEHKRKQEHKRKRNWKRKHAQVCVHARSSACSHPHPGRPQVNGSVDSRRDHDVDSL